MSVGELVAIVIALGGAAVTWGALLTRVKVLEARIKDAEEGRKAQGRRIGRLERWKSFMKGYERRGSKIVPIDDEEESSAGSAGDDE